MADGSNEIPATPELLKVLDLEKAIVTIDAARCQTEIVRQIRSQGGDYLIAVKGNQLELLAAVERAAERDRRATEADLRELLGRLGDFARRVQDGLSDAELPTRREIIRTLVKRVEVGEQEVRVVYKVNPFPFAHGPDPRGDRGRFQDRVRRTSVRSWN